MEQNATNRNSCSQIFPNVTQAVCGRNVSVLFDNFIQFNPVDIGFQTFYNPRNFFTVKLELCWPKFKFSLDMSCVCELLVSVPRNSPSVVLTYNFLTFLKFFKKQQ